MQNFLKQLKQSYWWSEDRNLCFTFTTIKGLPAIQVTDFHTYPKTQKTYLLTPVDSERLAQFDTVSGRYTIGICDGGDELFVSPLGIILQDYNATGIVKEDSSIINRVDEEHKSIND